MAAKVAIRQNRRRMCDDYNYDYDIHGALGLRNIHY